MRTRRHRHPYLEAAVFGAALLLAAFIARELWARRQARPPVEPGSGAMQETLILNPTRPPLPPSAAGPRTEQAVTRVAPIKLSRISRRKPKPTAVPAPK
jgi:hypothetical protein